MTDPLHSRRLARTAARWHLCQVPLALCLVMTNVLACADTPASSAPAATDAAAAVPVTAAQSAAATRRARPTGPVPVPVPIDPGTAPADSQPAAQFVTEARWAIAGYNNEEIIYTILITNHDRRILRCSTQLKGFYFENGEKHNVADRQISTVLPEQQVQAGNWLGMDKESGATYATKCRAL